MAANHGASVNILVGFGFDLRAARVIADTTIHVAGGRQCCRTAGRTSLRYVVDAKQGTIIGSIDGQTLLPEVGWIAGKDGAAPRLVVSTEKALNGYTVGGK